MPTATRTTTPSEPFSLRRRRVALLTKHEKERVVGPILEGALDCQVTRIDSFDTDLLGTFTREIPRAGSQREAARRKALKAIELSGAGVGLASEGTFGPDPVAGFLPWNVELLLWVDLELGIEVEGWASSGLTNLDHARVASWEELDAFARAAGFPEHGVVLRPGGADDPRLRKDCDSWEALRAGFQATRALGEVFAETDMRAHRNPSRRAVIALASQDLVRALRSSCPACGRPGFSITERLPGLPCEGCGAPTPLARLEISRCQSCSYRQEAAARGATCASRGDCGLCNP